MSAGLVKSGALKMERHRHPFAPVLAGIVILSLVMSPLSSHERARGWVSSTPTALLPPVFVSYENRSSAVQQNSPDYKGCGGVDAPIVNADYEQQVIDLVNVERTNRGIPPLKRADELDRAARYHSTDLGQDNYFKHDSYDGDGGSDFVCYWYDRVEGYYPSWGYLAENIAAGYPTPKDVMNGWMNSSGHKANILSTDVWEIGVGYYQGGGYYYRYWTQDFGRRSVVYPLIINNDAATTDTRDVSIYIYGDWQEMRLHNDGEGWGNWQPFQNSFSWRLANGAGTRTVTAELRKTGASATSSDTIVSTVSGPPILGELPDNLTFRYSIAQGDLFPAEYVITPVNSSGTETLSWTVAGEGSWIGFSPASGSTPSSFSIFPITFPTDTVATYTGVVTLTITSPLGVIGSPHSISMRLEVFSGQLHQVFFAMMSR